MEMKANVASAIKEMMAQMNSGADSGANKKENEAKEAKPIIDSAIKKPVEVNEPEKKEIKRNTVVGNYEPIAPKAASESSFASAFNSAVHEAPAPAVAEKKEEVKKETSVEYDNEKDESFEGRKILSNGIPTPYGNAAIKLPLTPPTAPAVVEAAAPSPTPTPAAPVAPAPAAVAESPAASTHSAPSSLGVSPAPARPMFIRKDPPNGGTYDKTVIANGTVITGDIISGGDLELSGEVTGNVRVDGELRLWGRIEGNVESGDLDVMGGKIKGNIITSGIVSLDTDSIVAGNVTASALSLDGKLKGDVDIEGAVTIGSTGVQIGKITARQLSIGQGAKLNSTIQMTNEDASAMAEEIFA